MRSFLIIFLVLASIAGFSQVNTGYFLAVGKQELGANNYRAAVTSFTTVINAEEDNFEAYFFRGIAKYNLGDYLGSDRDFTRAIELHPLYSHAYHYRGVTRDHMQDYYNALRDIDRAIELDPFNPQLFVSRGAVKLHMESYLWSLTDFDSALSLDPKNALAYLNRAVARSVLNDPEGALADCNRAIKLEPYNDGAYLRRGVIRYEEEDYEGAVDDFSYAIKLNSNNAYTYFNRALARYFTGDTLGALNDYSDVLRLDPDNALAYYNRALLKAQTGNLKAALEDFDRVLLINPKNIYTYYNRAITRHQLELYGGAIEDYTRAIELFPDFAGAYINRSVAYRQTGNEKMAFLDYEAAYDIINRLNMGSLDSALVMKRYSDSSYFERIIEFEADFNNVSMEGGQETPAIEMEPGFMVQYIADDILYVELTRKGYFIQQVADINKQNRYGLKFAVTNRPMDLSLEDAYQQIAFADSILRYEMEGPAVYLYKGIINGMVKNYKTAIAEYERALQFDPNLTLAYLNRAQLHFEMAEQQFMEEKYSSSVSITWGEPEKNSEGTFPERPDYENALRDLNNVLELNPHIPVAWFNRGNVKNRLRDYDGAISDYTAAILEQPGFAEAYFNRGLTLLFLDETERGCQDLSRAGELGMTEAYRVISKFCR